MYFLKEKINSKLLEAIITLSNGKEITVYKLIEMYNDRWITVHPPKVDKSDKGVPVQIDEQGTIQKGLGGKHTGKKISQIRKTSKQEPTKEPQKETAPASENPYDTEEKRKKIKDDYQKALNVWYAITDKIKAERFELLKDNPRFLELEDKYLKGDNEAYTEYKKMIDDATSQIKEKYKEELTKIEQELKPLIKKKEEVARYELEEKRRIDREIEEKAKTEAADSRKKAIQKAKDNYYPKSISGVTRGKDMTFEEADNGKVNPNNVDWSKRTKDYNKGYSLNCQSCVVCFEMRRRGYDVQTLPYDEKNALGELAHWYYAAWLDPETGEVGKPTKISSSNAQNLLSRLDKEIEEGKRYIFRGIYKGGRDGHVVSMYKEKGEIIYYDPQTNTTYKGELLKQHLQLNFKMKGEMCPQVLRVDNLAFNPRYSDKIVKKNT